MSLLWLFCFFFSSRRRHTRLQGDWSSDVCSSDLADRDHLVVHQLRVAGAAGLRRLAHVEVVGRVPDDALVVRQHAERIRRRPAVRVRSEERREGKSVDLGGRRIIKKKKKKKE